MNTLGHQKEVEDHHPQQTPEALKRTKKKKVGNFHNKEHHTEVCTEPSLGKQTKKKIMTLIRQF